MADLYTVMLGIREHKVAFTKDISKFYQCVKADEAAQHVRRILLSFGEEKKDPTIFFTTRTTTWTSRQDELPKRPSVRQPRGLGRGRKGRPGS